MLHKYKEGRDNRMEIIPLAKSKILSYYHEIKQIVRGEIPVPRCIKIFPAEVCNHRCRGCHSAVLFSDTHPFLDTNMYYRLIDECSKLGVESVNFGGGGEPLMHPEIAKFIEYASRRKMGVGILTNGTLLNKENIDNILSFGTFVRIGMDGATRQVYAEQTGADHLQLLLDNIEKIILRKKKLRSKTTIGLKFLITEINSIDIKRACILASKLGVNYLQFKISRGNIYEIDSLYAGRINRIIEKQKAGLGREGFYIFGGAGRIKMEEKCFLNMLNATLDSDGSLYICHAFQHRKKAHKIGSLNQKSFSDIWFNKEHTEKARRINIKQCQSCNCSLQEAHGVVKETMLKDRLHLQFI